MQAQNCVNKPEDAAGPLKAVSLNLSQRHAGGQQASSACVRAAGRRAGTAPVVQHQGNVEQQVEDIALAVPEVPAPTPGAEHGQWEAGSTAQHKDTASQPAHPLQVP